MSVPSPGRVESADIDPGGLSPVDGRIVPADRLTVDVVVVDHRREAIAEDAANGSRSKKSRGARPLTINRVVGLPTS